MAKNEGKSELEDAVGQMSAEFAREDEKRPKAAKETPGVPAQVNPQEFAELKRALQEMQEREMQRVLADKQVEEGPVHRVAMSQVMRFVKGPTSPFRLYAMLEHQPGISGRFNSSILLFPGARPTEANPQGREYVDLAFTVPAHMVGTDLDNLSVLCADILTSERITLTQQECDVINEKGWAHIKMTPRTGDYTLKEALLALSRIRLSSNFWPYKNEEEFKSIIHAAYEIVEAKRAQAANLREQMTRPDAKDTDLWTDTIEAFGGGKLAAAGA